MADRNFNGTIEGLYETHLTVSDLPRSIAFYRDVLGLELALESPERNLAFFWVGNKSEAMLGLWSGQSGPLSIRLHFAFRTRLQGVLSACDTLNTAGVQPLGFNGEDVSEPVVIGWMPAVSIYFKDPDRHSIEMLCLLDQPPDPAFGVGPYSAWTALYGS